MALWKNYEIVLTRVVLDSFFGLTRLWLMWHVGDSTPTRLNTWLFLFDSTPTQLKSQSCQPDSTLTQLFWVRSDSRLITFYLILTQKLLTGGGGAVDWSCRLVLFLNNATYKFKIVTFSLRKNKLLNIDSNSIQLTQLWLKWRSAWLDYDSTHIIGFHGRLNSDSTHLGQSPVKFDSRLTSRAQPWS